jgi:peptidoglycan/xylan/chitin deacetylase (PgdA/CDA1 family)
MASTALASFVVSIDLELAWGVWDKISNRAIALAEELERPIVRRLLDLFERYDIPATWATVGRVFDGEAAESSRRGKAWSAPETVEWIMRTPGHEVASHGFEHKYFPELSVNQAHDELGAVKAAHQKLGAPLRSIVYPRNQIAHVEHLPSAGIKVYRSHDVGLLAIAERGGSHLRQVANLVDKCIPVDLQSAHASPGAGNTVDLPSSLLLLSREGVRDWIRPSWMQARIDAGLRRAQRDQGCFHLWFHPSNFYFKADQQFATLEATLHKVASLRARGTLATKVMADFC